MRTLSITSFMCLIVLWGVYSYLKRDTLETSTTPEKIHLEKQIANPDSPAYQRKLRELNKIGNVINEQNVNLDHATKEQIRVEKKIFDVVQNLKEKQAVLEQSFLDRASSIKDIKHIQNEISEIKIKLKKVPTNTEKWDPKFIYYLMMQENYSYQEVNAIRSLSENGINPEEINYINELVKEEAFLDRITSFKSQGESGRTIASHKRAKEKDDFNESTEESTSMESKLIEMNYNHEDKEEMVYGNN
jgi:hypothetical protein